MSIQTPWEAAGSPEYNHVTSQAEEAAFMAALTDTGRVALTQIGTAPSGQPINLVRLGITPPPYAASPASGLWVSSQHTRETSPREAVFKLIRDMAETTDPDMLDYLAANPMFLLPTPYPDTMGQEADPDVIDHNRDHLRFTHSGTRALWSAIRTINPQMFMDMHTGGVNDVDIEQSRFIGVDPDLRDLGQHGTDSVRAYLASQGISTGPLTVNEWDPRTLRNVAGLAGMVGFLSETYGGNVMSIRINADYHAVMGVMLWHGANSARIEATRQLVTERAIRVGREAEDPYWIGTPHTREAMSISPPPMEYTLSPARWDALADHRAAFGITGTSNAGEVTVSMAQPAKPLIPLIMDADSTESTVKARRASRPPEGNPVKWGPVRVEGREFPVTSVDYISGGQSHRVWP